MADVEDASDYFLNINIPNAWSEKNHLEQYLSDPVEPNVREPLKWWWGKRDVWPGLAQMALDYLSVPCKCFTDTTYHG